MERTVKNIVDVRRPQVEEAVELVMRQFQEELFDKWSTSFRWLVEFAKLIPHAPDRFFEAPCRRPLNIHSLKSSAISWEGDAAGTSF